MMDITILAVIDHNAHELYIEKASILEIETKYNGEEEDYIKDKYGFTDTDDWSWEYVTKVIEYDNGFTPIEIKNED